MTPELTPLCKTFVEAMNAQTPDAFIACFTPDAVVEDEGNTYHGHADIRNWITAAFANYRPVLQVTQVTSNDAETVISGPVSGTFDGSPVVLHYHLMFRDGKIATLRCIA